MLWWACIAWIAEIEHIGRYGEGGGDRTIISRAYGGNKNIVKYTMQIGIIFNNDNKKADSNILTLLCFSWETFEFNNFAVLRNGKKG